MDFYIKYAKKNDKLSFFRVKCNYQFDIRIFCPKYSLCFSQSDAVIFVILYILTFSYDVVTYSHTEYRNLTKRPQEKIRIKIQLGG